MKATINGKVVTVNPESVKRVGCVSKVRDEGKSYYSFNVFFKNGKIKFIQGEHKSKIVTFMNDIIFAISRKDIAKELQESF